MSTIYIDAKKFIKDHFDDYKNFVGMHDVDFESIELKGDIVLDENSSFKVPAWVGNKNGVPVLHYDPKIVEYSRKHSIAILFHEFTHATHILEPFPCDSASDWIKLMQVSSEFMASRVEMAYILGVKKYDLCVDKNISESEFYLIDGTLMNTKGYILFNISAAKSIISKDRNAYKNCSTGEYHKYYMHFHNSSMYYFGKKSAYEAILGKPFECREEEYFLQFNDVVQKLGYLAQTNDGAEILKIDNILFEEFKKYFPNDNLGE